ncbi:hypothetical protein ACFE04_004937 [Oxalis oulophora]
MIQVIRLKSREKPNPYLEEVLSAIDVAVEKIKKIMDGKPEPPFTTEETKKLCDYVSNLRAQKTFVERRRSRYDTFRSGETSSDRSHLKPDHRPLLKLWEKYRSILKDMIVERVPLLTEKSGNSLLEEVLELWSKYETFKQYLAAFFGRLEKRNGSSSLDAVSKGIFNFVLEMFFPKFQEATFNLVNQMREGKKEGEELLKNALDLFAQVAQSQHFCFNKKLEWTMLAETAVYCAQLSAQECYFQDSFTNYLSKVSRSIAQQEEMAELWPLPSTKTKVVEVMKYILLEKTANMWAEDDNSSTSTENQAYPCDMIHQEIDMNHAALEAVYNAIDVAVEKKKNNIDGNPEIRFSATEIMELYTRLYNIGMERPPHNYSIELYWKYESILRKMLVERRVPVLTEKNGKKLLEEVVQLWSKYEALKQFLLKFFGCLDRRESNPSLDILSKRCFCDLEFPFRNVNHSLIIQVLVKVYDLFQEAIMDLVNQMREWKTVDEELLKKALDLVASLGRYNVSRYYEKLELVILAETALYGAKFSSECLSTCRDSHADYSRKVSLCLAQEEKMAELWPSERWPCTKTKVLEVLSGKFTSLDADDKQLNLAD